MIASNMCFVSPGGLRARVGLLKFVLGCAVKQHLFSHYKCTERQQFGINLTKLCEWCAPAAMVSFFLPPSAVGLQIYAAARLVAQN